ncbi:MAG TPA: sensor histidine kinase [bacterium]|nr:sensor histidine kinase [bacterium]
MNENSDHFLSSNKTGDVKNEERRRLEHEGTVMDRAARKHAESDTRRSHEELRNLAARLQSVREEERRALSRELHDNLGQALTAMKLDLNWIAKRVSRIEDKPLKKEMLEKAREFRVLIEDAITTIHRISTDLRPSILDEVGLWPALESEVSRFASRTGIECVAHPCTTLHKSLDEGVALAIFRIVQEVLTNIARHAKASVVEISCASSDTGHTLSIVDNGRGITTAEAESPGSLGLIGIRERARGFGGEVTIAQAGDAGGTRVSVRIPADSIKKDT